MSEKEPHVRDLYDRQGQLIGVFLSAQIWERAESELAPILERVLAELEGGETKQEEQAVNEPLADWNLLTKHWDFQYPVDTDVACDVCGNATEDWQADNPRKFYLKAASLGGLVRFQCRQCQAYITKRHFKDSIRVETKPPSDT